MERIKDAKWSLDDVAVVMDLDVAFVVSILCACAIGLWVAEIVAAGLC